MVFYRPFSPRKHHPNHILTTHFVSPSLVLPRSLPPNTPFCLVPMCRWVPGADKNKCNVYKWMVASGECDRGEGERDARLSFGPSQTFPSFVLCSPTPTPSSPRGQGIKD